jgi:hypothetical protein
MVAHGLDLAIRTVIAVATALRGPQVGETAAPGQLAGGELEVEVPARNAATVGAMPAVEVFSEMPSGQEMNAAEVRGHQTRGGRGDEPLVEQLVGVVDAAVDGDFSHRICPFRP